MTTVTIATTSCGNGYLYHYATPEGRARELLLSHLTPIQRQQFADRLAFDVTGGATGRTYCICAVRGRNVTWIRKDKRMRSYDTHPRGRIPLCDVMLAQKLALEGRRTERRFLRMACHTTYRRGGLLMDVIWPYDWFRRVINIMLILQLVNIVRIIAHH